MIGFKGTDGVVRYVRRVALDGWRVAGTTTSTTLEFTVQQIVSLTHYSEWPTLRSTLLSLKIEPVEPSPVPVVAATAADPAVKAEPSSAPAGGLGQAVVASNQTPVDRGGNFPNIPVNAITIGNAKAWFVRNPDGKTGFFCVEPLGKLATSHQVTEPLSYGNAMRAWCDAAGIPADQWTRLVRMYFYLRDGL